MRRLLRLITRFLPSLQKADGIKMGFNGLRTGDQRALLGGAAVLAYRWLRSREGERELIYRREVPLGSTLVIRHGREDELPEIEITEQPS